MAEAVVLAEEQVFRVKMLWCVTTGHRHPGKNYTRVELKRDPRRTFRAIRKITGKGGYRRDLSMVSAAPSFLLAVFTLLNKCETV